MHKDKLVIDVNVFIASLFFGSQIGDKILQSLNENLFVLLSCPEFLVELTRKIDFFTQKANLDDTQVVDFWLNFAHNKSFFLDLQSNLQICRDPKDDYLINLAVDGLAKYLVTRDKDILEVDLDLIKKLVITPEDFVSILRSKNHI